MDWVGQYRAVQWEGKESPHMSTEVPSLPLHCSEAVDFCPLNYWLLHYSSAQQLIVWGRLWREVCTAASWLTTHFMFHGFLVWTATWYICALTDHVSLLKGDTKCLAAPAPITWPASCPPRLCILFTPGACTHPHTNAQQLPKVLKSYRFSPNVESCTVNWKKPYIHYNRISEHGVGWGVNSCQAQETI